MKNVAKILGFWTVYLIVVTLFGEYIISRETDKIIQFILTFVIIFLTTIGLNLTIKHFKTTLNNKQ